MAHRPKALAALVLLAPSIVTASCAAPRGPLTIEPTVLHLRAHGTAGRILVSEAAYGGYYRKALDPDCSASVTAVAESRHTGDPAHLIVTPVAAGRCGVWISDDHAGSVRVTVDVAR